MSTTYGPRTPALTPARATRLAKAAAPDLRWSSEKGARGVLVRLWDAEQDGTDRTELRLLNEARRLINATDLSASVVALRSRRGVPQYRLLVTSEAQEAAEMQEREDARRAALAAAAVEVAEAQAARAEEQAELQRLEVKALEGPLWDGEVRRLRELEDRSESRRARAEEPTADALLSEPVIAARLAADAAWEEEAHAAGFADGDAYASFLTEDLRDDAEEDPAYPPYTTEEAEEAAAEGLNLYAPQGGAYSHEVRTTTGRHLGRVRCVTETMGSGFWVRYAAYRPDGSRVGYSRSRVGAATLLLRPERGNTFWIEQEKAAQAALTPAVVTFTNPELWGPTRSAEDARDEQAYADRLGC